MLRVKDVDFERGQRARILHQLGSGLRLRKGLGAGRAEPEISIGRRLGSSRWRRSGERCGRYAIWSSQWLALRA
jgi:hypothetical protein